MESIDFTDVLPPGTTFVSFTAPGAGGWVCSTPAVGAGGTVTCSILAIAVPATATLVVNVSPSTSGVLTNTANFIEQRHHV